MFNPSHLVVARKTLMAVVPIYGDVSRMSRSDGALIIFISVPENAVADVEESRLVTGHLSNTTYSDRAHIFASTGEIARFGR